MVEPWLSAQKGQAMISNLALSGRACGVTLPCRALGCAVHVYSAMEPSKEVPIVKAPKPAVLAQCEASRRVW